MHSTVKFIKIKVVKKSKFKKLSMEMGFSELCSICDEPVRNCFQVCAILSFSSKFDASYAAAPNVCSFL